MKKYSSITKGNYRQGSVKSRYKLSLILVSVMLLGLISPWVISGISYVILYPFHATSVWVKTSDGVLPTYLRSRSELVKELEDLRIKVSTGVGTEQSIKRLLEENTDLRSMLKMEKDDSRITARVLKRPNILPYDLLQIDKGSNEGIVLGAPVYSGLDSLIGIVVGVTDTHSFVDLFTSPGFVSTAFVFGPDIFAPIEGVGGGVARIKLPQGVSIEKGQLVILPGVSSAVYGEIIEVQNEPTQPEQYGYIAPPLGINNLLYVSVDTRSVAEIDDVVIDQKVRQDLRQETIASTTVIVSTSTIHAATTTSSTTEETIGN